VRSVRTRVLSGAGAGVRAIWPRFDRPEHAKDSGIGTSTPCNLQSAGDQHQQLSQEETTRSDITFARSLETVLFSCCLFIHFLDVTCDANLIY
jgi:hypothetical protein